MDFSNAPEQVEFALIPNNTIAKARIDIKPGDSRRDRLLTDSKYTNSSYLNCEFVIMEGEYVRRKIFDKIGVHGSDEWINMGKARIRAILESSRGIDPKDMSESAIKARSIDSYEELDGMEVTIKIGVDHDKSGNYEDKNKILKILPNNDGPATDPNDASEIPF
jgi:hypothetical protein